MANLQAALKIIIKHKKILFEAYAAMAKEKVKRASTAAQTDVDIDKKIQEAYRRGDLDMLDSLERISFNSPVLPAKVFIRSR